MYLWMALPEGIPSGPFAERLLMEEGVVLLPGSSFGPGGEGFVRVSFIAPPARIAEAATRASRVLTSMTAGIA
jgi:LL-diaminopimelate aminotransferase